MSDPISTPAAGGSPASQLSPNPAEQSGAASGSEVPNSPGVGRGGSQASGAESSSASRLGRSLRRPQVRPPTQTELDTLGVKERLELQEQRRVRRHQRINSLVLLLGVAFTAGGLVATALTLRNGQDQLQVSREQQVTDRYAKATEDLGSPQQGVRIGAIYALERIARDSPRDQDAIMDVLAAYIREHGPAPVVKPSDLPAEPETDVAAALSVLTRLPNMNHSVDLHQIRIPHSRLRGALLHLADLRGADLSGADLDESLSMPLNGEGRVTAANLAGVDLTGADLSFANLNHAVLLGVNLQGANLTNTDLTSTTMVFAALEGANLSGADLYGASLNGAGLTGAHLQGADLRHADLRGVHGISRDEIRRVAVTDPETRF